MTPEELAELRDLSDWWANGDYGDVRDLARLAAKAEREVERLRGWIAWIDIHCNRTGWYGVESALFKVRNGEEAPS